LGRFLRKQNSFHCQRNQIAKKDNHYRNIQRLHEHEHTTQTGKSLTPTPYSLLPTPDFKDRSNHRKLRETHRLLAVGGIGGKSMGLNVPEISKYQVSG
jgi:hypothetical protein